MVAQRTGNDKQVYRDLAVIQAVYHAFEDTIFQLDKAKAGIGRISTLPAKRLSRFKVLRVMQD